MWLSAAAACLQLWLRSRALLGEFFGGGAGLALCLSRLLDLLESARAGEPARSLDLPPLLGQAAAELSALHAADRLFSITPLQLARRAPAGSAS